MVDEHSEAEHTAVAAVTERSAASPDSSLERRACRICQSETGDMLRPCGCAGTMGDIHAHCLSTWVTMSQKRECEICHEEYSRGGSRLKPLKQWAKPKFGYREIYSVMLVFALSYFVVYMLLLFKERHFIERIHGKGLPCRSDDLGRIVILIMLIMSLATSLSAVVTKTHAYLRKQTEIRFLNKKPSV